VMIRGYVDRVEIVCGSEQIACHRRSYAREDFVFDPLHYLALLEQKPGALDQAAPLAGWQLPDGFSEALHAQPGPLVHCRSWLIHPLPQALPFLHTRQHCFGVSAVSTGRSG
jgi:hypothetical protein